MFSGQVVPGHTFEGSGIGTQKRLLVGYVLPLKKSRVLLPLADALSAQGLNIR